MESVDYYSKLKNFGQNLLNHIIQILILLKKNNIKRRKYNTINFGDNETFIENYKRLKSSRKMGELYGCDKGSITAHARKIGYDYSNNKEIKITNIPIETVIEKYEQLKSCKAVGKEFNCSDTAVRNYLLQNGYQLKNFNSKLNNITKEDFIKNYDELKSAEKMSTIYNCSATAILNYAKKIGYDPNSNKEYKLTQQQKEEILNSYQNSSSTELAKKYNVTRGMITKIWHEAGLANKQIVNAKTTEIDLKGQQFGYWTVLYKTDNRTASGGIMWHCRCKCGIERDVSSLSLRQGMSLSCGAHSNISKGNEKIKQLLTEANIPFILEKKFETCKDLKELPFDFYVNNQYLIEYDGIQHFQESIFDYEYTHKHDLIKSEWCKNNNIPLIRIPYTHFKQLCLEDLLLETSNFIEYAD